MANCSVEVELEAAVLGYAQRGCAVAYLCIAPASRVQPWRNFGMTFLLHGQKPFLHLMI